MTEADRPNSTRLDSNFVTRCPLRVQINATCWLLTHICLFVLTILLLVGNGSSQATSKAKSDRIISGVVLTDRNEAIPGASITAVSAAGMTQTVSDGIGKFRL
ncbi:MAG: hypothetical protein ACRD23_08650, partial [Terriglobales bacterium]